MKKTKLSLCLASGFVVAMSLAACSGVSAKDNAVVTIKDANGRTVDILSDAIYNQYKGQSGGISKFYDAILEALIRYEYENPNAAIKSWTKSIKSKDEIKIEAQNNVKNDKNTASEKAKTNGTSYETEWSNILSSHNCDDEAELLEYYIYQLEKEDITDKFFLYQKDSALTEQWIGVTDQGQNPGGSAKAVFPYHIRHVLVSISGGSTNFYDGTITEDEAKNLGNTMLALLDSKYQFGEVAQKFSGDTGSAAKGGDLGIMATTTAFVNEFKLGIYAFDAIYNHQNDTAIDTIRKGLGLDTNYKFSLKDDQGNISETNPVDAFESKINDGKLQEVPYDAFIKIKNYAEDTKDNDGLSVYDDNSHYYPRNVLYNYYVNFHNPFVITKQLISTANGLPVADESEAYNDRFTTITVNGVQKKVLCDEEGNVVIGVRSEHGVHFMIMEKSIFDYSVGGNNSDSTSLEDYYTTLVPSDSEFPHKTDGTKKDTYVNFITTSDASTYTTRASEVKSAIKSFDSTYDYRLFDYIMEKEGSNIEVKDAALKTNITEYISRTREGNSDNSYKSLNEAWRTYAELVALQYENRTEWTDVETTTDSFKTIHPRCAIGFKDHDGTAWEKGGVCYYAK